MVKKLFIRCSNLTSVIISDSITSIGEYAFSECNNLSSIVIGNSVKTFGKSVFAKCPNLKTITIIHHSNEQPDENIKSNYQQKFIKLVLMNMKLPSYGNKIQNNLFVSLN